MTTPRSSLFGSMDTRDVGRVPSAGISGRGSSSLLGISTSFSRRLLVTFVVVNDWLLRLRSQLNPDRTSADRGEAAPLRLGEASQPLDYAQAKRLGLTASYLSIKLDSGIALLGHSGAITRTTTISGFAANQQSAMSQGQAQDAPLPPQSAIMHNMALAGAIITPLAMLLPPRKMDIRFFVLAGTFSLATNHLAHEYTGQSIYSRFGNRVGSVFDSSLPEGAKRTQKLLKEQKEREAAEKQRLLADHKNKTAGLVKDIWMGGETEDWQEKRAEEHRQSIEEGKGLSGIIFEQIADVWNGNYGRKDSHPKDHDQPPPERR
ncbi:hypothetical protein E4U53_006616 [Claviceps sorghi]|nr:hypothetical protein E4U53_006616 [Claviceps sorghi]